MTDATARIATEPPNALPPGTRLGEFELRQVLGVGGFGIVYLAFDHALEREVAVKEYMPASLAGRTETMYVSLRSQSDAETFALGLKSFVNEARLLARFDLPSLIRVHRFWEANGTAYMVMPVLRGQSVKALRQAMQQPPDEAWLRALLDPMLATLERLHAEGVFHRDISPDNIHLEADGHPVLLDLGAARRVIGDATQTLTAILKPAYAPIEQYAEVGAVRQGPWTDLYALGATLHFLLLGRPPAPATARTIHDEQPPLAVQALPGCSVGFLQVVDWMLSPRPGDRPRNVDMVRDALAGRLVPPARPQPQAEAAAPWERTQIVRPPSAPAAPAAAVTGPTDLDLSDLSDPSDLAPAGQGAPAVQGPQGPAGAAAAAVTAAPSSPQAAPPAATPAAQAAQPAAAAARRPPWLVAGLIGGVAVAALAIGLVLRGGGTAADAAASAASAAAASAASAAGDAAAAPAMAASAVVPLPSDRSALAALGASAATAASSASAAGGVAGTAATATLRPSPATVAAPAERRPPPPRPAPAVAATPAAPVVGTPAISTPPPAASRAVTAAVPAATVPAARAAPPPRVIGPNERCGRRVLLAQWLCIQRECGTDELRTHPECVKWRADQEEKANPTH